MANEAAGGAWLAQGTTRWDRFLYWASRFHAMPEFNLGERDYKLDIAQHIQAARKAMADGNPDWIKKLNHAITAPPNNLTNWRETQPFIEWCRTHPDEAGLAFRLLWNEDSPVHERFNRFAEVAGSSGRKIPIAEISFFHMAMDPLAFPMFRATAAEQAMDLTGYPMPKETGVKPGDNGRRYEHFLRFLDIMIDRAHRKGIEFQDRLDAQSACWILIKWQPLERWPEEDKAAFQKYLTQYQVKAVKNNAS